ncbi:MAG: stage II sporulation protein M [Oscillospiraceae bacterium]|jgi:stage II sporulation protein M|nr:stage II sporulation protein M [Oscillospiraceae bacterium]
MTRTTYSHINRPKKKKNAAVSLRAFIKKRASLNLLYIILMAGIVCGVFFSFGISGETLGKLGFAPAQNTAGAGEGSANFARVFFSSFSASFLWLMLVFILGFCALGMPFILILDFLQGVGFGISAACAYSLMAGKGILYNLALLFPGTFISFIALIYACEAGIRLSLSFFGVIYSPAKQESLSAECRAYFLKFVIFIFALFAKAFAEALTALIFLRFF